MKCLYSGTLFWNEEKGRREVKAYSISLKIKVELTSTIIRASLCKGPTKQTILNKKKLCSSLIFLCLLNYLATQDYSKNSNSKRWTADSAFDAFIRSKCLTFTFSDAQCLVSVDFERKPWGFQVRVVCLHAYPSHAVNFNFSGTASFFLPFFKYNFTTVD